MPVRPGALLPFLAQGGLKGETHLLDRSTLENELAGRRDFKAEVQLETEFGGGSSSARKSFTLPD